MGALALFSRFDLVKRGVAGVKILRIEIVLCYAQSIGEALIVNDLACAQKSYSVVYVGVVGKAQDIIVGRARFLLCYYHVFAMFLIF